MFLLRFWCMTSSLWLLFMSSSNSFWVSVNYPRKQFDGIERYYDSWESYNYEWEACDFGVIWPVIKPDLFEYSLWLGSTPNKKIVSFEPYPIYETAASCNFWHKVLEIIHYDSWLLIVIFTQKVQKVIKFERFFISIDLIVFQEGNEGEFINSKHLANAMIEVTILSSLTNLSNNREWFLMLLNH